MEFPRPTFVTTARWQDTYPSLESIDEMKVTAFDNNAEFAQMGDVTFTTKSGTNSLHGSGFEYFQNADMDATVLNFPVKAPRTFNTFGGSLGGPVTIPKLYNGRDKTYFFADYEGNRKTQSYPEELIVPSAQDWAGNLNDMVAFVNSGKPVMNPFTGAAYPNNTIPTGTCQGCINPANPVTKALQSYYPSPTPGLSLQTQGYNYLDLVPDPANSNGFDVRIDQIINSKQQVYVRYSFKNAFYSEANNAGVFAPANNFLPNVGASEQNRSMVASYNYSITPTLVNEFRFGFANYYENDAFPIEGATAISDARAGLRSSRRHRRASHGRCLPDLRFLRQLRNQHRAGQGWTNHFREHAIHRQRHQGRRQAHASLWIRCAQRAFQFRDVLRAL